MNRYMLAVLRSFIQAATSPFFSLENRSDFAGPCDILGIIPSADENPDKDRTAKLA